MAPRLRRDDRCCSALEGGAFCLCAGEGDAARVWYHPRFMFRRSALLWLEILAIASFGAACGLTRADGPSDDPAAYDALVARDVSYAVQVSAPRFVVPSAALPPQAPTLASNNNVDIEHHDGRLFLSWRTSEQHFASRNAKMYVVSSTDGGRTFEHELTVALGSDVREPRFYVVGGALQFAFFQAGVDPFGFEPQAMWRTQRLGRARWAPLSKWGEPGEIPWTMKVRGGVAYMTSYWGEHYAQGQSLLDVRFSYSLDGLTWQRVDGKPFVYRGGVSEAAFEFERDGTMWAVTRNEDGDDSGFGSHVCSAPPGALSTWSCSARSSPERYDSPSMFRHGDDLYLIARRDVGGPFDLGQDELSFADKKRTYLLAYSARPKRTALYRIDKAKRRVKHVVDLPGAGDTAFPAVRRTGPHTFVVANYTSPLHDPERPWIVGQTAEDGTQIYLLTLTFVPQEPR